MLCAIFKNNNHNQTPDAETNVGFLGANKHHKIMRKFDAPIRTEIQWNKINDSSMTIIGETDKAFLFVISKLVRKGTSKVSETQEREQWIPKSVWNNDDNFDTYLTGGDRGIEMMNFNPPYFLK